MIGIRLASLLFVTFTFSTSVTADPRPEFAVTEKQVSDVSAVADVGSSSSSASGRKRLQADEIKTLFAFGDSYTSIGDGRDGGMNMDRRDRGSSGGKLWLQYVADSIKVSNQTYDFAIRGSTIKPNFFQGHPGEPFKPSFEDEVDTFERYFVKDEEYSARWNGTSSLFAVMYGINDIVSSIRTNVDYNTIVDELIIRYRDQVLRLYNFGARNFLLMPIAPFERTPEALNPDLHDKFKARVTLWNEKYSNMVATLPEKVPEANVVDWDFHAAFSMVLDHFEEFGFRDNRGFCGAYDRLKGSDHEDATDKHCPYALAEYVWKDAAHPTWPVHKILAESIVDYFEGQQVNKPLLRRRAWDLHRRAADMPHRKRDLASRLAWHSRHRRYDTML
ncbi:hypothetical protein OIV83_004631 [Microbotryomycetes sp. JL201]|nr:hypothetical protein OIV83_004631 [Microbotryomycetes sp. JL201]